MNCRLAAFLVVLSTFAISGCDSGGDVAPDESGGPVMTAEEKAAEEAYSKAQMNAPRGPQ